MGRTRESWVDVCKGIAILLVVMGHVVTSYRNSNLLTNAGGVNFICDFIYSFHMPLFFVISGYLASKSNGSTPVKQQITKKLISYGIPYLVFSVGSWLLKFVASPFVNSKVDINDLLMIFLYPINAMWFLYALLFISIIHILVNRLIAKKKGLELANVAIAFLFLLINMVFKHNDALGINAYSDLFVFDVLGYYFYFEFGSYILRHVHAAVSSRIVSQKEGKKVVRALGLSAVLAVDVGLFYVCWANDVSNFFLNTAFALAGTLLTCAFARMVGSCKLFEVLGKQSMPIYLLHGYVISATRIAISAIGLPLLNGYVPLVLCSVTSIGLSLLAYEICRHIPFVDFCFYPLKYKVCGRFQKQ